MKDDNVIETNIAFEKIGTSISQSGVSRHETLEKFVQTANSICEGRTKPQNVQTHVATFKYDDFFDAGIKKNNELKRTPLSQVLLKDIGSKDAIVGVSASMVAISDCVSVVDIYVSMDPQKAIQKEPSDQTRSKTNQKLPL